MVNLQQRIKTQLENYIEQITVRDVRAVVLFLYCTLFQIAIVSQIPFIQIDFIVHFYVAVILFFIHHAFLYLYDVKSNIFSYFVDFAVLFVLMAYHPILSSFNLIVLLILLFSAGYELKPTQSIVLTAFSSVVLSVVNMTAIRWEGVQNIFSLALFNFSFVTVTTIAQQFRYQLAELKEEITVVAKKLRSQEEFSQVLIEQMPTGIVAFGSQGNLLFVNAALKSKMHLSDSDLQSIHQQSNEKSFTEVHYFNPALKEKKIYELTQGKYFDEHLNDTVHVSMLKDATEIKHLQDQMRQSEKLAAIGQLAAGIAHEIRNPLAGISGSIQLLSTDAKNPDDQKLMKIILKEIDRLNLLITEFLDYSKPSSRPDQKIDLALVLDEVIQNIKLSTHAPASLEINVSLKSVFILGFADKLKQAFLNIAMNAVQAMSDTQFAKLTVKLEQTESEAIVIIQDTGKGMTEETKKRIFEPFFTTKSKGTGLGLAITHKVLESHDVEMQINSEINKGTEFILKFKKV